MSSITAADPALARPGARTGHRTGWVDDGFLRELHDTGAVWAGAGLGGFAVVGAVLTLGLVRRWGEVFPRWIPGLAGRRVPIKPAVVPASLVAVTAGVPGRGHRRRRS